MDLDYRKPNFANRSNKCRITSRVSVRINDGAVDASVVSGKQAIDHFSFNIRMKELNFDAQFLRVLADPGIIFGSFCRRCPSAPCPACPYQRHERSGSSASALSSKITAYRLIMVVRSGPRRGPGDLARDRVKLPITGETSTAILAQHNWLGRLKTGCVQVFPTAAGDRATIVASELARLALAATMVATEEPSFANSKDSPLST